MMEQYKNLIEAFKANRTHTKGVTFINSSVDETFTSYNDLYENAAFLLHNLQQSGLKVNSHVLFQISDLEKFITLFWACTMGKMIPIPIEVGISLDKANKLYNIWKVLPDSFIVTDTDKLVSKVENFIGDATFIEHIRLNSIAYEALEEKVQQAEPEDIDPSDICYIQFSSGSTGRPKGVPLTHHNILTNVFSTVKRYKGTSEDSFVSWKPLVHDFSMTAYHITPLVLGANHYRIPTELFIRAPSIWFSTVDKYRVSMLGSPNFGFRHFLKFYKRNNDVMNWDLSCVKGIIDGAETISSRLRDEFFQEMSQYNLPPSTLMPAYGLAEATLVVALSPPNEPTNIHTIDRRNTGIGDKISYVEEGSDYAISFVEIGHPLDCNRIIITDSNHNTLEEEMIGHIKMKGENVISEYYKDAAATEMIIKGGWVDSGDLGFIKNGKLTFTGRAKEMIVLNGSNYYPYDIEENLLNELDYSELNKIVACGGYNPNNEKEELVIFVFHKGALEKFAPQAKSIKQILLQKMGLMVSQVIPIKKVPKTTSGKIKRLQLIKEYHNGEYDEVLRKIATFLPTRQEPISLVNLSRKGIAGIIKERIEEVVGAQVEDLESTFLSLGIKSLHIIALKESLEEIFGVEIQATDIFDYPSINSLSHFIDVQIKQQQTGKNKEVEAGLTTTKESHDMQNEQIAIVGMSCRFPAGGNSPEEFWNVLMQGTDGIVEAPADRWEVKKYLDENKEVPGRMYTSLGGFLNFSVKDFDAQFFNISPKEAKALDPQQRLLLEVSWEAFEDAGIDPSGLTGSETGVFLGMSGNDYTRAHLHSHNYDNIDAYSLTGTCFSTACGRLSYFYGFQGPSFAVDTACSSSLVALHCAFQSLRSGESKQAIVGSAHLYLGPEGHIGFSKLGAISPDGHCKTFDDSANGYARSEGCSVIILKRLSDAIENNDRILGVVRGSAVNQDGKSNGLTAPNGLAQQRVIWSSLQSAGLTPADIDYVEAHGTGTPLGDPIEVNAISDVYGQGHSKENLLRIGSVKSNIGHSEPVAGLAGITKILLALENQVIPANLNFRTPNKLIDWQKLPVKVVDEHSAWLKGNKIRRGGVNSFGFGGTNAHAIIEEAPEKEVVLHEKERPLHILNLSAKNDSALQELAKKYIHFFASNDFSSFDLGDVCYTANRGRAHFNVRLSVIGKSGKDFQEKLTAFVKGEEVHGLLSSNETPTAKNTEVAFLFTGQGSQYVGMGRGLYEHSEVFKKAFDKCDELFFPYFLLSLKDLIYEENANEELVTRTDYAQPLIFAIEYATAMVWESFGLKPAAIVGHSIGEFAGAVLANVLSLEDAVKLVATRGRLMNMAPGKGVMYAVFANEETITTIINPFKDKVSIAAVNMPGSCVISGEEQVLLEVIEAFTAQKIETKPLVVSHAFHSPLMEPVLAKFEAAAATVPYQAPQIEYISTLTAEALLKAPDAQYWRNHLRNPVRFFGAIKELENKGYRIFLEVGATNSLTYMGKRSVESPECTFVNSLKKGEDDWKQLLLAVGSLYVSGVNLDWKGFDKQYVRSKKSLPKYPFQHSEFWMEPAKDVNPRDLEAEEHHPVLGERISSPAFEDVTIYQKKYTFDKPYFMYEHIIFDTRISPAAAHCSLLFSMVKDMYQVEEVELKNVEFVSPLITSETESRLVQLIVKKEGSFKIISRDYADPNDEWLQHAHGEVYPGKLPTDPEKIDIEKIKEEFTTTISHEENYKVFDDIGFNLGDGFKRIKQSWKKGNLKLDLIEAKKDIPNLADYRIYPGVIDSIFQTQAQLVTGIENFMESQSIFIPFLISSVKLYKDLPDSIYCYSIGEVQESLLKSNINIYNEAGDLFMEIHDIVARRTEKPTFLRELNKGLKNTLYQIDWEKQSFEPLPLNIPENENFIVFADETGTADKIIEEILINNGQVVKVNRGKEFLEIIKGPKLTEVQLNPENKEDLAKLLNNSFSQNTLIYCWGLTATQSDALSISLLKDEQKWISQTLINLSQLAMSKTKAKVSLHIVTKNGVVPSAGNSQSTETLTGLSQSTLWGFARTAMAEIPEIWKGIVDIESDSKEIISKLLQELEQGIENQVLLRENGDRLVARFNKVESRALKISEELTIQEDATYLITGGLGDLGILFAKSLLEKGAKHLVLTGRSEPQGEKAQLLEELKAICSGVEYLKCDVADDEALKSILKYINDTKAPIKGVLHTAGFLDDAMLTEQSWERFEKVYASKVYGSWNLHKELEHTKLDFFVLFSSIVSAIGNMGQANYAAANTFMNQLAQYRKTKGLPAMSICWGAWAEIGMAAKQENRGQRASNRGLQNIMPKEGLEIFNKLMSSQIVAPVVININWKEFSGYITEGNKPLFFNNIRKIEVNAGATENKAKDEILKKIQEAQPDERYEILLEFSLKVAARIAGFDNHNQISPEIPVMEQGFDSIIALDIKNNLAKNLGIELPAALFFNYPSIGAIASHILDEYFEFEDQPVYDEEETEDGLLEELSGLMDDTKE